MTDCHRIQKRTIDEAKILLFSSSSAASATTGMPRISQASPSKISGYAGSLVFELGNWRSCLAAWITAQRSYARALAGWTSRCVRPQINADDQTSQSPLVVTARAPPVHGLCVRWAWLLDSVSEAAAVEGIDFFANGIGSVGMQQREEGAAPPGAEGTIVTAGRMMEIAEKVLCAGMSAAVGSLTEFSASSAEGYEALVKKFEEGRMAGRADS